METLLRIASLGQRAYGRVLFRKAISGMVMVVGLVIVIAIMVSFALVAALIAAYFCLIYFGITPVAAMIIIALLAIALIVALIVLTLSCLHHLRQMPKTLLRQSPFTSRAMDTLDAFTDGLMAE
jgi:amino acid transporter